MKRAFAITVVILLSLGGIGGNAFAKTIFITMATASTGGGFYPAGSNLAQLWNEKIPGIKANSQASKGSY